MYIQTEKTPNHNAVKFIADYLCETGRTFDYERDDAEEKPSFVKKLFEIPTVVRVFVTSEFVTVTKTEDEDFEIIKPEIFEVLFEARLSKERFIENTSVGYSQLDQTSEEIVTLLDERVKPAVAMDGGDIRFVSFDRETGIVYLKLEGIGCPSSSITTLQGIKRMLQHYIPEVWDVASV